MKNISILLIALSISYTLAQQNPLLCKWKDPVSGNDYDYSSLYRPNGWKVESDENSGLFGLQYFFNFCGNHPKKCNG